MYNYNLQHVNHRALMWMGQNITPVLWLLYMSTYVSCPHPVKTKVSMWLSSININIKCTKKQKKFTQLTTKSVLISTV